MSHDKPKHEAETKLFRVIGGNIVYASYMTQKEILEWRLDTVNAIASWKKHAFASPVMVQRLQVQLKEIERYLDRIDKTPAAPEWRKKLGLEPEGAQQLPGLAG